MSSMRAVVAVASLLLASMLAAEQASGQATAEQATAADGAPTVMAVWVQKEVNFPYKGLTQLLHLRWNPLQGARDPRVHRRTARVQGQCQVVRQRRGSPRNLGGVEPMPWVYITAALPQLVTPELLAELAKPDPKAELVARATGKPSATAEATAQFPAQWRRVRVPGQARSDRSSTATASWWTRWPRSAFAQLGARVIEDLTACVPRQVNPGSIRLTLDVLQPVPEK